MYQEMDSEEEECTSHGGTLPRRDSVGSHQSARVVLRSQSTKSHRRTGSRAEAKRASILSKHTAFSSPMVSQSPSLARSSSSGQDSSGSSFDSSMDLDARGRFTQSGRSLTHSTCCRNCFI